MGGIGALALAMPPLASAQDVAHPNEFAVSLGVTRSDFNAITTRPSSL